LVYFECGALDLRVVELQAVGVVFEQMPRDEPWLWREARLADPSGNPICLYHAGEARLNPPWRVGGQQPAGLKATLIETERLRLRDLEQQDLQAFFTFNSDPAVTRYLPYGPWQSTQDATRWYQRMRDLSAKGALAYRVLERKADGAVLGSCLLMNHEPAAKVEVGYLLGPEFQGQGYMREAVQAVVSDAFASHALRRVEAHIDARNAPSQRLVEQLGFVREAVLREAWNDQGAVSDATIYGVLRREWDQRRAT
jgi:RimJ/RimL family protein N-acetyltransferase